MNSSNGLGRWKAWGRMVTHITRCHSNATGWSVLYSRLANDWMGHAKALAPSATMGLAQVKGS